MKSSLCAYKNGYILQHILYPTSYISRTTERNNPTPVAFKSCAPFIKFIRKPDGAAIDDGEELDLIMLIWNLRESSSNYGYNYGIFLKMKQLILMQILQTLLHFKSLEHITKLLENKFADRNNSILKNHNHYTTEISE